MSVIAVIPAHREQARIQATVSDVLPFVDRVVVVDDGSGDDTATRAQQAGATVVGHIMNRGQGAALRTGTEAALRLGASIVIHLDADGQHDPSFIPSMLEPLQRGEADVVFGSRFLGIPSDGMPLVRRLLFPVARTFSTLIVGVPRRVTDPQSGFRALSAQAAASIDFRQDRMAHCSEILRLVTRSPLRWKEIPVRVRYSSETLRKGQQNWDAARVVWQLFLGAFMR